jgi:hypothetical protein
MDYEAVKKEIERTKVLLREHRKYFSKLELKAAKFGLHLPPYLEVEIDNTKEKIDICVKRLDLMTDGSNKLMEINQKAEELRDLAVDYGWYILRFSDIQDHTGNAMDIQELGTDITGLILEASKINKEYVELTNQYNELLSC